MKKSIPREIFLKDLLLLYQETFETHFGIYLDESTSLLPTLDSISAAEASIPVGKTCATIAAQVEHVIFYLEVLERYLAAGVAEIVDWGEVWERVSSVSDEEWKQIKIRLIAVYERVGTLFQNIPDWKQEDAIGSALAIVVHTAYHLGEIRQALCIVSISKEK